MRHGKAEVRLVREAVLVDRDLGRGQELATRLLDTVPVRHGEVVDVIEDLVTDRRDLRIRRALREEVDRLLVDRQLLRQGGKLDLRDGHAAATLTDRRLSVVRPVLRLEALAGASDGLGLDAVDLPVGEDPGEAVLDRLGDLACSEGQSGRADELENVGHGRPPQTNWMRPATSVFPAASTAMGRRASRTLPWSRTAATTFA